MTSDYDEDENNIGSTGDGEPLTHPLDRTEAKLAALQAPPDVAGLVKELDTEIRCAPGCEGRCQVCPVNIAERAIDALLSLHSENAKLRNAARSAAEYISHRVIGTGGAGETIILPQLRDALLADFPKEPDK